MSTQTNENNATVKVLVKSTHEVRYYSQLNDALDELDETEGNTVTALADVSGFNSLTVPEGSELIIPSGMQLSLDVDATLNVLGGLTVADAKAICGDTMVSLYIGENADLEGDGLSADSNFYRESLQSAPELDTTYHWILINEDPFEEAWSVAE